MTVSKKRLLIMIAAVLGLLLVALLLFGVALRLAVNRIRTDAEEPPWIDPAYAAGQGIYFPDRTPIHDSNVVNILLLGTDFALSGEERGRADANMLVSLNTRTGAVKLISFERGIGVPVPGRGSDLLTHAYHWGGPALSQSILSQMFCVEISGYVQVDFEGFAAVIDAVGGVDVELNEKEMQALNGWIPTNVWAWTELHEGWNHLSGHDALEYCRLRSIDSDWHRQERQRTVIDQVRRSCLKMNPIKLMNLVLPWVHTNLSANDVMHVLRHLPMLLRGEVSQLQVPDSNGSQGTIRCIPEYESLKIENFLYGTQHELKSPY